jgi:hypothetical protein
LTKYFSTFYRKIIFVNSTLYFVLSADTFKKINETIGLDDELNKKV